MSETRPNKNAKWIRPVVGTAIISMLVCGLFFPLLIAGIAQVALPYQANGEVVQFNGRAAGSELIAQGFNGSKFFQPRNSSDSASGVDPDITVQTAYSQIARISTATNISAAALKQLVDSKTDLVSKIFGNPYVDVLDLNLALIQEYPSVYSNLQS